MLALVCGIKAVNCHQPESFAGYYESIFEKIFKEL